MISNCRFLLLTTIRSSQKIIPSFCFQLALSLGLIGVCFLDFIFVTIAEIRMTSVLSFSVLIRSSGHTRERCWAFP